MHYERVYQEGSFENLILKRILDSYKGSVSFSELYPPSLAHVKPKSRKQIVSYFKEN